MYIQQSPSTQSNYIGWGEEIQMVILESFGLMCSHLISSGCDEIAR